MHQKHLWNRTALLVMAVYLIQGAIVVIGLAEFLLTRNAFQFSWIQIALLAALGTLTWSIKPLYGFLTDLLPLFGSRRKYYLLIASVLPMLGYGLLALYGTSFLPIALCIILANIGLGFADVIADGMVVERSTKETVGWYQAICWRAKAVGIFFGEIFAGLILERKVFSSAFEHSSFGEFFTNHFPAAFPAPSPLGEASMFDVRFTFLLAACLPIVTFVLALFLEEKKVSRKTMKLAHHDISLSYVLSAGGAFVLTGLTLILLSSREQPILSFLSNSELSSLLVMLIWCGWIFLYSTHLVNIKAATKTLLFSALFIFLWRFTPSFGAPWQDYYLNTLEVSPERLGYLSSMTPFAWVIGSFLYVKFIDRFALAKILFWTVILSAALSLTQLAVASPAFGNMLGSLSVLKYPAAVLLFPAYFLVFGFSAWQEILSQLPILNLDAVLTFFLEILFIISFLPLLKLIALVTPKGVEATNFAVLAGVSNLGLVFGSLSGGFIYNWAEGTHTLGTLSFTGLHITVVVGAVMTLVCLPVLKKIRVR